MTRQRWATAGRLAVAILVLLFGTACTARGVAQVDLSVLVEQQEAWDGREVVVTGVVQSFDAPEHYWVEDVDQNRVELVPPEGLADLVGQRVTVRGQFTFREGEGRRISIEELTSQDD